MDEEDGEGGDGERFMTGMLNPPVGGAIWIRSGNRSDPFVDGQGLVHLVSDDGSAAARFAGSQV